MAPRRSASPIDVYLRSVPKGRREALEDLRSKIRSVVPQAEECLSYRIPAFRIDGGIVAGFHATRSGGSYFPFSGSTLKTVAPFVRSYSQTKSALHFVPEKPLPVTLVRRLIKARRLEIEERSKLKRPPSSRRAKA